ncbi:MAG: DUF4838 domain-containing protein [Lentisphaerae bacterium]|nr:DUF4838 domain-containing protein [Lentisphaerota bacterium]
MKFRWALVCLIAVVVLGVAARGDDLNRVTMHKAPSHKPVVFVADGEERGAIMVVQGGRQVNRAVKELCDVINEATGVKLSVVKKRPESGALLLIGASDEAQAVGLDPTEMPPEGFAIKTAADTVYIVGKGDYGLAWGVYEFAERFVGVRWYWPTNRGGRSVEPLKKLVVKPVWLSDAPAFRERVIWPSAEITWNASGQQLGDLHTALRSATTWPVEAVVHSPNWSKVADYVKNRPEVFEMRGDGTRNTEMLCYGNPRTLETYLENIEAKLAGNKKAQIGLKGKTVTVSPADMEVTCTCTDCRKLWNSDGGQYGTASSILANFVQKLAVEVEKRWPELTVMFLPYLNYTTAPEGYKFPGNVEVQICGMPGLATYKEPLVAASEQANIDAWLAITGRKVRNWHYSCWPEDRTKAPYQYYHVIRDFYRSNRDKTIGTFINGVTDHWPRQHVSLYCWAKLLWDPDFDVDAAVKEYSRRMYGPAGKTMHRLVRLEADLWEKSRWPKGMITAKSIYSESFPRKRVEEMRGLLEKAKKEAAKDEKALGRIAYFETPFEAFYIEADAILDGKGVRKITTKKVGVVPVIDGKLDDEAWERSEPVSLVKLGKEGDAALYATTVRSVWTSEGIVFGFHLAEPTPDKLVRDIDSRDASLAWWNDNVELLMDVSGDGTGSLYHFILNANGAVYDAKDGDTAWDAEGVKIGAFVGGDFWSLECFIPYATLEGVQLPGTGVEWSTQVTRHRIADSRDKEDKSEGSVREVQCLNGRFGGFSNNRANFAPVVFQE